VCCCLRGVGVSVALAIEFDVVMLDINMLDL
jgi:hypothetical protein